MTERRNISCNLILCLIAVSMLVMFASCKTTDKISVDEEKSFFSEFEVVNDKVLIKCHITLINKFDTEKIVNLSARLPEDVTIGLVKNEEIKAVNEEGLEIDFVLPPNASKAFDVVFVGEFAGTNQKHDRNLPEIIIQIVR